MTLPQENGRLTTVTGQASTEDWDTTSGAGETLWQGDEGCYYREKRERTLGADTTDVLIRRLLIIPTGLRTWAEGEQVTLTTATGTITGKVQAIEAAQLPGIPAALQTTRLTLAVQ